MVSRFICKFKLYFNPPKKGDVFCGDPAWFITPKPIEYVLHGLKNIHGETIYEPIPSQGCIRFTVEHCGNLNYILGSEVLCRLNREHNYTKDISDIGIWKKRTQPRRMGKEMFEEFILNGMLWKE